MKTISLLEFLLYELCSERVNMPRRKVDVRQQISLAFIHNEEMTWNELLKKTGVSKGSLSKHLNRMIDMGLVETDVDTSKRPVLMVYRLRTKTISKALDWQTVPMKTRLQELKTRLQNLKKLDKTKRQKEFNKIFAFIVVNLLADHLTTFEVGLTMQKYARQEESAGEAYFYLFQETTAKTARLTYELFSGDPEFVEMFSKSVTDVIWIAEKIRPEGDKPSDLNQALEQIVMKLQANGEKQHSDS
jgi:DNA-binding MarR family transcriptional regulator